MKVFNLVNLIFFISLYVTGYCIPDSDGNEFITSFLYKDAKNGSNVELNLFFIPSIQYPSHIEVKYFSLLKNQTVTILVSPKFGELNKLNFIYADVVSEGHLSTGTALNVIDPRIFISSVTPIKTIASLYDKTNNVGDMYIVPPISFAGTTYLVKLPKVTIGKLQLLHIMTFEKKDVNVELITSSGISNTTMSQNFTINGNLGSPQKIISSIFPGAKKSFYIKASGPIIITAAANGADLNGYLSQPNGKNSINFDYVAYMPQPIGIWNGKTMLTPKDKRVTFADHTVALEVSPSDVIGYNILPIVTYSNINNSAPKSSIIPVQKVTEYIIDHSIITEFATQSSHAVAVWTRYGSPNISSNQTLHGMYIHYIPESTQFYNGVTQFITKNDGDYFEVYVENYNTNAIMTLNGQNIVFDNKIAKTLDFFNKTYTVFKITVPKAGLNTFNSSLKYIAYVVGKMNPNFNTSYGYLSGFNQSKLQTYWASDETSTSAPSTTVTSKNSGSTINPSTKSATTITTTTTKSASKVGIYSSIITFIYIFSSFII